MNLIRRWGIERGAWRQSEAWPGVTKYICRFYGVEPAEEFKSHSNTKAIFNTTLRAGLMPDHYYDWIYDLQHRERDGERRRERDCRLRPIDFNGDESLKTCQETKAFDGAFPLAAPAKLSSRGRNGRNKMSAAPVCSLRLTCRGSLFFPPLSLSLRKSLQAHGKPQRG